MKKLRDHLVSVMILTAAGVAGFGVPAMAEDFSPGPGMLAAYSTSPHASDENATGVTPDIASTVPPMEVSASEAREWIYNAGYTEVSPLIRATNADGIPEYRGTAIADGERYSVTVDSWGNIAGWH